jgi:vesicle-fusing ATPase
MITLKVLHSKNRVDAINNKMRHSISDIKYTSVYLKINNTLYKSEISNDVQPGNILVSLLVRSSNCLAIGDDIQLTPIEIVNKKSNKIKVTVRHLKQPNTRDINFISSEEMCDYYIYGNQKLLFEMNKIIYVMDVDKSSDCGYLTDSTDIDILSIDYTLCLATGKKIKHDLFDPNFNFETLGIGGLNSELKEIFKKALSLRAIGPEALRRLGLKCTKGILLYGPPGCGKTLIARNISSVISNRQPKIVNEPELLNKFIGQSEENIRNIFREAINDFNINKDNADLHVIIFDEIDSLCKTRGSGASTSSTIGDNLVNQLLCMLDGINNEPDNFFVIAMTNRKDLLDPALLRVGRLEVHIEIKLPDASSRKEILRVHINKIKAEGIIDDAIDLDAIVTATENFTGAELAITVRNTISDCINNLLVTGKKNPNIEQIKISQKHFINAIRNITPMFGITGNNILNLISLDNYTHLTKSHELCYSRCVGAIKKKDHTLSFLIYGPPRSGKTVLISKICSDIKTNYFKYICGTNVINMSESEKCSHITASITNALVTISDCLIVLDDLDTLIGYTDLCHVNFSNKLFHLITNLIKTASENPSNRTFIIANCNKIKLYDYIKYNFVESFTLATD